MRIPDDKQCPIWQADAEAVALDPDGKRVRVQVYEDAIKPAIVEAGYVPQRVGQGQTTERIDYEAEAKIRAARLVIADFTHDRGEGIRGSVYYEAGFARALNIPYIFTAKKGSDVHFNVDHFLRIEWEDAEDLRTQLTMRIRDLPELQR